MQTWTVVKSTFADKKLHLIMLGILVTLALALVIPWGTGGHYYFYQALTIIVCVGSGISDTWQSARSRIWATCFGLGIGTIAAYTLPMNPWIAIVGYLLIFFIAERFNWQEYISAGGSMFLVVYFYHNAANHENVFVYSGWRLVHTLVGIVIILLLSRWYLSNDASGHRQQALKIEATAVELLELVRKILLNNYRLQESDLERLKSAIVEIDKLDDFLRAEHKMRKLPLDGLKALGETVELMDNMRIALYYLWANGYQSGQLDETTAAQIAAAYAKPIYPTEKLPTIYTNNLAVRKLLAGRELLLQRLMAISADGVAE
ncbi:MAG: FUSC family protein [Bacillota bacterium]